MWRHPALCLLACLAAVCPLLAQQTLPSLEKQILAYETADRQAMPPAGSVLLVGSSSMSMWTSAATGLAPYPVLNRGVAGSRMVDVLAQMDHIALPYAPRVLVHLCGTNDIGDGKSAEVVLSRTREYVERFRQVRPGTPIVLLSGPLAPLRQARWTEMKKFNQGLADYAKSQPRMWYVDINPALALPDGQPKVGAYRADNLHPSPASYAEIAKLVRPAVEQAWASVPGPIPGDADFPNPRPCPRHVQKVAAARKGGFDLVMVGDSITQTVGDMGGEWAPLRAVWDRHLAPRKALNLGYSGYRTEDILWNLRNGELDFTQSPKVFVLLIGTNNTDDQHYKQTHTAEQLFAGTKALVDLIRARHPTSKVLILRPFPCGGPDSRTDFSRKYNRSAQALAALRKAGELTAKLADNRDVFWLDVGEVFLRPDGTIDTALMPDLIHPNAAGAEAWVSAILPKVDELLGRR